MKEVRHEDPQHAINHSTLQVDKGIIYVNGDHNYFCQTPSKILRVIELDSDGEVSSELCPNGVAGEVTVSTTLPSLNRSLEPPEESVGNQLPLLQNGISCPDTREENPVASNCNGSSNPIRHSTSETSSADEAESQDSRSSSPKPTDAPSVLQSANDGEGKETSLSAVQPQPIESFDVQGPPPPPHLADSESYQRFLWKNNVAPEAGPSKISVLPTLEEMLNTTLKLTKLQKLAPGDAIVVNSNVSNKEVAYVSKLEQKLVSRVEHELPAKIEELYNSHKYQPIAENDLAARLLEKNEALMKAPSLTCPFLVMKEKSLGKVIEKGKGVSNQMSSYDNLNPSSHQVMLRNMGISEAHRWLHRDNVVKRRILASKKSSGVSFNQNYSIEESEDKVKKAVENQLSLLYTGYKYCCKLCPFASSDPPIILDHIDTIHISKSLMKSSTICPLCYRKFDSPNHFKNHVAVCATTPNKTLLRPIMEVPPGVTTRPATYYMQQAMIKGNVQLNMKLPAHQPPTIVHAKPISLPTTRIALVSLPKKPVPSINQSNTAAIPPRPLVQQRPSQSCGPPVKRRKLNCEMADCRFVCELCDGHVHNLQHYGLHLERKHHVSLPKHKLDDPGFRCNHCFQACCTVEGYERHFVFSHGICYRSQNPEDSGTCGICFKLVDCRLKQHLETVHSFNLQESELIFKCKVCSNLFNKFSAYEKHYVASHTKTVAQT